MKYDSNVPVERIIAKIDNDFNPDNSDWIPRIGAWCFDALAMLDITPKEKVTKRFPVRGGIVYNKCGFPNNDIIVKDVNGCIIPKHDEVSKCGCGATSTPTGEENGSDFDIDNNSYYKNLGHSHDEYGNVINATTNDPLYVTSDNGAKTTRWVNVGDNSITTAQTDITNKYGTNHNVEDIKLGGSNSKYYIPIDCNKLEIVGNTPYVTVEYDEIKTIRSEVYGCDIPAIPNNGLLIEALANWCMYKMLCRGYIHPVFNLAASQYGTNPYYNWTQLKDKAKTSVINGGIDNLMEDGDLWRSSFYISTFDPRR